MLKYYTRIQRILNTPYSKDENLQTIWNDKELMEEAVKSVRYMSEEDKEYWLELFRFEIKKCPHKTDKSITYRIFSEIANKIECDIELVKIFGMVDYESNPEYLKIKKESAEFYAK